MSDLFATPLKYWNAFIDAAARGVTTAVDRVAPPRRLTLVDAGDGKLQAFAGASKSPAGSYAINANGAIVTEGSDAPASLRGAIVDLVLAGERFLVRDLPLPAQEIGRAHV